MDQAAQDRLQDYLLLPTHYPHAPKLSPRQWEECTVKGKIILYANSKTRVELKKYFNNKKNPLTAVQAKPEQANVVDYYIDETVKIRPNNHILTTEERIA